MPKATFHDFLARASSQHGQRYTYPNIETEFMGYMSYITIICSLHGPFVQLANNHANQGSNCKQCARRLPTSVFVEKAIKVHGEKWDYSRTLYKNRVSKVEIGCPHHGFFWQSVAQHLIGSGCAVCGQFRAAEARRKDFVTEAQKVHGDTYDYSSVVYVNGDTNVDIRCPKHGMFSQMAKSHLLGANCRTCGRESQQKTMIAAAAAVFEDKARAAHKDKYDYSQVQYTGSGKDVIVVCPEHGEFRLKASTHLRGQGCCVCSSRTNFSKKSCDWLDWVAQEQGIVIDHGRNSMGQEYRIPGTPYRADGHCSETGVLYEFFGDFFHGNLDRYEASFYNTMCHATMGELHAKTMKRLRAIEALGFTVVVMWESRWDDICRAARKRVRSD